MTLGLLLIRLAVGGTLVLHAARKLGWLPGGGMDRTAAWLEDLGFRPGRQAAEMAAVGELAGGALLALGLLTPVGSAIAVAVMAVAIVAVHLRHGFFASTGGFEYPLVLLAAAAGLGFTGPGMASVDALLGWNPGGAATGMVAAVVGFTAAGFQLRARTSERPVVVLEELDA